MNQQKKGFGTAPVFFTAIATILGAILFLRFGYAVGTLGFWGVIIIILIGHFVTIPTALALSEIATNQKVEGGGEYFIISRSFGLNIGATIGIALYFSQAISVAFYVIAFTEAFSPFFEWFSSKFGFELPRQVISLPAMAGLSFLILKKGADLGVKALYFIVGILFVSLIMFFIGKTDFAGSENVNFLSDSFRNMDSFFIVFAIVFPAFTGMTAGVGLSGDLKKPSKSIPLGSILATVIGMIIYIFITWKFSVSASPEDLISDQMIMSKIAIGGAIIIPLGLAASTISSALGSIMVAPRTLQALGRDNSLPINSFNKFISKGKRKNNEPFNATLITVFIAFIFVAMGNVNAVAQIISMFFMITYGSLNLISFLYHYGADPSYRPSFRTKKIFSLIGFVLSIWLMFKMNTVYTIAAIVLMIIIYLVISRTHKDRQGLEAIFQGVVFQISRKIHVFAQRSKKAASANRWRPSAICVCSDSFDRANAFELLNWISHDYGFGTYVHLIKGYYSQQSHLDSERTLKELLKNTEKKRNNVYIDTLISPSYTSAIAQIIQLPSISGLDNNMVIFEYQKDDPKNLDQIIDNYSLVKSGNFDICVLASSGNKTRYENGIDIWIKNTDLENANLLILMGYIILGHPDWKRGRIKVYYLSEKDEIGKNKEHLIDLINDGRIPISKNDIETIHINPGYNIKKIINEKSAESGLTLVGFRSEAIKHDGIELFMNYETSGDILFI
ncbi:amino acid permease, partial [Bacteroidota bacterium]